MRPEFEFWPNKPNGQKRSNYRTFGWGVPCNDHRPCWRRCPTRADVERARKLTSGAAGQLAVSAPRDKGRVGGRAIRQAVMRVNAEQASKNIVVDADPPLTRGRPRGWGRRSTDAPVRSTGVLAMACRRKVDGRQGRPGASG